MQVSIMRSQKPKSLKSINKVQSESARYHTKNVEVVFAKKSEVEKHLKVLIKKHKKTLDELK